VKDDGTGAAGPGFVTRELLNMDNENPQAAAPASPALVTSRVKWDDSKMTSTYANVVNATSTRQV
jgi:hypothetical protein